MKLFTRQFTAIATCWTLFVLCSIAVLWLVWVQ